jgi:hypothetical protein
MTILRRPDDRLLSDVGHLARQPRVVRESLLGAPVAGAGRALLRLPPAPGTRRA